MPDQFGNNQDPILQQIMAALQGQMGGQQQPQPQQPTSTLGKIGQVLSNPQILSMISQGLMLGLGGKYGGFAGQGFQQALQAQQQMEMAKQQAQNQQRQQGVGNAIDLYGIRSRENLTREQMRAATEQASASRTLADLQAKAKSEQEEVKNKQERVKDLENYVKTFDLPQSDEELGVWLQSRYPGLPPEEYARLKLNAKNIKKSVPPVKESALGTKIKEFSEIMGREPTEVEKQRMFGVDAPPAAASVQIAAGMNPQVYVNYLAKGQGTLRDVPQAIRDKVLKLAQQQGIEIISDTERSALAAFAKVQPIINGIAELSEKINTGRGVVAKVFGYVEKAKAQANLNDDISEYNSLVSGFTPLVARSVGHVGVLTEQDVQSVRKLFPDPGDSKSVRDRKVARLKQIFGAVRGATEEATTKTFGGTPSPAGAAVPDAEGWSTEIPTSGNIETRWDAAKKVMLYRVKKNG